MCGHSPHTQHRTYRQVQPLSNIGIRFPSQRLTNYAVSTKFCRSATVRIFSQISPQLVPTVTIPDTELKDQSADLSGKIEQGFGLMAWVFHVSQGYGMNASLPTVYLCGSRVYFTAPKSFTTCTWTSGRGKKLEDLYSRYNIEWSHGKEQLESGKPDMMKGSYYANPILDVPTTELSHVERYPSYYGPNIWPRDAVPELELLDVGFLLTYHCDRYTSNGFKVHENEGLLQILLRSRCHKGRLLYYFPSLQRDEKLRFPKEMNIHEFMVPDESISFGDYTEKLLDKCYDLK